MLADRPEHDVDYKIGYLSGMVRGDAHLGSYADTRRNGATDICHRFRLALTDRKDPWIGRASFWRTLAVATSDRVFAAATGSRREIVAISASSYRRVERIRELTRWPAVPSDSWRKGFLAGIFDAEGSVLTARTRHLERRSDHPRMDLLVTRALRLPSRARTAKGEWRAYRTRLRGGLAERLRFFHRTDPAITRKQDLEGHAIKTDADLRVVSIEPLPGAMRLYDITTGTGDFIANGVVSHNCFARPTHEYLDLRDAMNGGVDMTGMAGYPGPREGWGTHSGEFALVRG